VTSGIVLPVDDANFAGLTKTILLQGERDTDEVLPARDGMEAIEYLFHQSEPLSRCRAWCSWTSACLVWTEATASNGMQGFEKLAYPQSTSSPTTRNGQ
jgi:hypothetical protein